MEGKVCGSKRSRYYTLNEVLSQLEGGEGDGVVASADVFISPPGEGNNSEEDDVNDDVQESVCASYLSGRQLRSQAHCCVKYTDGSNRTIGDGSDGQDSISGLRVMTVKKRDLETVTGGKVESSHQLHDPGCGEKKACQ
ncbi:hypothetical protein PoB_001799900 [Plakobranchus ocellatus]|uniref:Uncharacterized protein n=1 Tax=Plakobranchus ocellatus TaxID=259542 RepID=A0AAV3ZC45_9GAST|nr:hypothetical protein PoB_001799900 [Plakobranchus ocellatus]